MYVHTCTCMHTDVCMYTQGLPALAPHNLTHTFRQAWKGSWSSLPLMTMLGKSKRWTSKGSNIPFLVTMICFGCSSTGSDLIRAATSSAVFHFANYNVNNNNHNKWTLHCLYQSVQVHIHNLTHKQTKARTRTHARTHTHTHYSVWRGQFVRGWSTWWLQPRKMVYSNSFITPLITKQVGHNKRNRKLPAANKMAGHKNRNYHQIWILLEPLHTISCTHKSINIIYIQT